MDYIVSITTGNDGNPGNLLTPFKTINKAKSIMVPGDRCLIRGGERYLEQVVLAAANGGVSGAPITYRGYENEMPIIDCQDIRANGFQCDQVPHIVISDLEIDNGGRDAILLTQGGPYTIQRVITRDHAYGDGTYGAGGVRGRYVDQRMDILDCQFYRNRSPDIGGGAMACFFNYCTGSRNILRCIVDGRTQTAGDYGNNAYYDGLGGSPEAAEGAMYADSEWAYNQIKGCYDDHISADGIARNCRIHHNFCFGAARSSLSAGPVVEGPLYVYRNIWINPGGVAVKFGGDSPGALYYYHNTFIGIQGPSAYTSGGGGNTQNHHYRNNIFICVRYCAEGIREGEEFDYNAWYTSDPTRRFSYVGANRSFARFQELGQEQHGLYLGDSNNNFINPFVTLPDLNNLSDNPDDYQLLPTGPCVDRGIFLSAWPDPEPFQGNAPDIGALESSGTGAPIASFNAEPDTGPAPLSVSFQDTSRGNIVSWAWDFGDGATSTAQNPTHIYSTPGTYTVTLTVTDSAAVTDSTSQTIEVVLPRHLLTVSVDGQGQIDIEPPSTDDMYEEGTQISINAFPAAGWEFVGWVGDFTGNTSPAVFTMGTSDMVIQAVFVEKTYVLTINTPLGQGTVLVDGLTISGPYPRQFPYTANQIAILEAVPASQYRFDRWDGDYTSTEANIQLEMTGNITIWPVFEEVPPQPNEYIVTVSALTGGTTDPVPEAYPVTAGDEFKVEAKPNKDFQFDHWEGDLSGSQNPISFAVNDNMSIVAVFVPEGPPSMPAWVYPAIGIGVAAVAVVLARVFKKP